MSDILKDREWSTEPFPGYDMVVIPFIEALAPHPRRHVIPLLATWIDDSWVVPSWERDSEDSFSGIWVCERVTDWPDDVRFSKL